MSLRRRRASLFRPGLVRAPGLLAHGDGMLWLRLGAQSGGTSARCRTSAAIGSTSRRRRLARRSPPGRRNSLRRIRPCCCRPRTCLVIDCDSREAEAEAQQRGLRRSYTVRTHHGRHVYYRRPATCPVTRVTKAGGSRGIDVLTHGVLIAPPSRHRFGTEYAVVDPSPIADPADWAVAWLRDAPPPRRPDPRRRAHCRPTSRRWPWRTSPSGRACDS